MPSTEPLSKTKRDEVIQDPITAAFERHLTRMAGLPDWWKEMKQKAMIDYLALPMPTRKAEQWRFANLRGLAIETYEFNPALQDEHRDRARQSNLMVAHRAGGMVFVDDELLDHEPVSPDLAKKGVIWEPIESALRNHPEIIKDYFMTQEPHLGSEKFAALHSAFVSAGCLLYVPKGVEIDLPFMASHWSAGQNSAVFPHTLVIAEENARVTLVDAFESLDRQGKHLACGFNHLFTGEGARIDYQVVQNWSQNTWGFQINSMIAGRDATVHSLAINLGASHYRSENQSLLNGEGSRVEMYSLSVTDKDQQIDQRTLQSHLAPHASSDLLYKNALMDDSRTVFSGLIKVAEDAQKTDAYQSNRNLLVSPTAEANSLPGLEIQANDVRCTHGSTTGQIDESELFYLLSRGIRPNLARELLVFGFFEEVILKVENNELASSIRNLIQTKFREDMAARKQV
ncbi:MAG: Fe-S cluster assembly protein SufD [Verrucomicrobia bacterium]|nr:MAG: Fe-S cluster assembly protein SufD [Verrucomicrobiota bacterium]